MASAFSFDRGSTHDKVEPFSGSDEAGLTLEPGEQPAPDPERLFSARSPSAGQRRKELMFTAAAAKSLTQLFAGLILEPGSGNEIPAKVRTRVLNLLITEAHGLADDWCRAVVGPDAAPQDDVPPALRARLLQQAATTVFQRWTTQGKLDTQDLRELMRQVFGGELEALDQSLVDLFGASETYVPATTPEARQARLTESVVRASGQCLEAVNAIDLAAYDPDRQALPETEKMPAPFTYGLSPYAISADLLRAALTITRENTLTGVDADLATTWTQNSLSRAVQMVLAEYRFLTDRALRASFKETLYAEAAVNQVQTLYAQILARVETRARNGFLLVERNALDAMGATAFTHFLPKKPAAAARAHPDTASSLEENDHATPSSAEPAASDHPGQ